jgi:hypothetical protein
LFLVTPDCTPSLNDAHDIVGMMPDDPRLIRSHAPQPPADVLFLDDVREMTYYDPTVDLARR